MAVLINGMEIPDSCFLCRFCRRQEYGEYIGEDTAWSCTASKKRITDGQDLIATFKHPDCPLVEAAEVPDAQPEQEREFIKLTVRESSGRPYYSIIYLEVDENGVGHDFEGYSSYDLDFISDYLKRYFGFGTSVQLEKRTDKRTETHACDAVSRQAVLDKAYAYGNGYEPDGFCVDVEDIQALPSVYPEIVRCKDCENWDTSWECSSGPNYHYCVMADKNTVSTFYCGDAERRTDSNGRD